MYTNENLDDIKQDMSFCRLAYGFLPSEYCCFEFENKTNEERKQFMSDIDTLIFGNLVNDISFMQRVIDKGQAVDVFGYLFKRDYVVIEGKKDYNKFKMFTKKHPVFVRKTPIHVWGKAWKKLTFGIYQLVLKNFLLCL